MSDTTGRIINALKSVPAKKLLLIDVVNQITDEKGNIDTARLAEMQKEVNLAAAEANAYARATGMALEAVRNIGRAR